MAMFYFIDGYNVTKRDPATRDLSIEEQRDALERRMRVCAPRVLGSTAYLIVWDAAGGEGVAQPHDSRVAYTRLPTADDSIVARVRRSAERVGVVTSDRALAERCQAVALNGVEIVPSSRLFADAPVASKPRDRKKPMPRDVGIPPNANEINRELKKLWGIED